MPDLITRESTETYLVAVNENKQYFGLVEEQWTTSPFVTTDPLKAKLIHVRNKGDLISPHEATWYFESSDRMKYWLTGFKMIPIKIHSVVTQEYEILAEGCN